MDTIPMTPAPRTNLPAQTMTHNSSPGTDDTGFSNELNHAVSTKADNTSSHQNPGEKTTGKKAESETREIQGAESDPEETPEKSASLVAGNNLVSGTDNTNTNTYAPDAVTSLFPVISGKTIGLPRQRPGQHLLPGNATNQPEGFVLHATDTSSKTFQTAHISLTTKGDLPGFDHKTEGTAGQDSLILTEIDTLVGTHHDKLTITAQFAHTNANQHLPGYMNSSMIAEIPVGESNITLSAINASATIPEAALSIKPDGQQPLTRQDAAHQLLSARIASIPGSTEDTSGKQGAGEQQGGDTNSEGPSQTALGQSASLFAGNRTSDSLSSPTFSTQFQHATAAAMETAPTATGSQTALHFQIIEDNKVINQIVSRFSLQNKIQSGRISLQLHPAELGELKIDVEMKGDSLKANIYAQTQQAQDIIDKNLPKLKAMLQENGISVENLIVTAQTDTVDDFNHRQSDLFHKETAAFSRSDVKKSVAATDFTIEAPVTDEAPSESGVNVTI